MQSIHLYFLQSTQCFFQNGLEVLILSDIVALFRAHLELGCEHDVAIMIAEQRRSLHTTYLTHTMASYAFCGMSN